MLDKLLFLGRWRDIATATVKAYNAPRNGATPSKLSSNFKIILGSIHVLLLQSKNIIAMALTQLRKDLNNVTHELHYE